MVMAVGVGDGVVVSGWEDERRLEVGAGRGGVKREEDERREDGERE